jgi:cell division transport system permease protein
MTKPMARSKVRRSGPRRPGTRPTRRVKRQRARAFRWPSLGAVLVDHARVLVASLGRLVSHPLSTLMTVAVIGIALALPAGLHLIVTNGRALSGQWAGAAELSVYLRPGTDLATAKKIAGELESDPIIAEVRLIANDEALAEFREYSGFGSALDVLPDNPLPHVIVILPADDHRSAQAVDDLRQRLADELPADLVQADTAWVARLQAMLDLVRRTVFLAGLFLALGVLIIVGNTIRLDIQNRRDEIEVSKLVGATDAFIRRPFLYTGTWYGILGGLLALGLVTGSLFALDDPVRRLSGLYGSGFRLTGPGLAGGSGLIAAGIVLGWLGSWVSATRTMRRIEPGDRA